MGVSFPEGGAPRHSMSWAAFWCSESRIPDSRRETRTVLGLRGDGPTVRAKAFDARAMDEQ